MIGSYCFIGCGSIIMPNVTLGDHVVVAAGSVVTRDVASNCIVAGNPAKVIKTGIDTIAYGMFSEAYLEKAMKEKANKEKTNKENNNGSA